MKKNGFTHDNVNNATVDWYTPSWIFENLGLQFDLDPCAPSADIFPLGKLRELGVNPVEYTGGVPWIPAKKTYTLADDGLKQDWHGKVWLNPPYGKHTPLWLKKMHEHRDGVALVFARTDCKWFHDYCAKADAILFLSGRIKFVDGLGKCGGSGAGSGSMLIAWGEDNVAALYRMAHMGFFAKCP